MAVTNLDRKTVAALPQGEGLYWDRTLKGFGYLCRLDASGTIRRSFIIQYRHNGRQRKVKLGDAVKLTADQARKRATELLAKVTLGIDLAAEKDAQRVATALTFAAAVQQYLDLKKLKVRHSSLRLSTLYLTGGYFASIHRKPLSAITRSDISARLDAIFVESGAPTAAQARKHLSAFFVWSMTRGHCLQNPVIATEKVKSGPGRERVLSNDELRAVWNACRDDDLGRIIKLLMLTGCRAREIGELRWSEIDLDVGTISLPAERVKNGRTHTLMLPKIAMDIIRSIPQRVGRDCLFGDRANGFTSWAKQHQLGDGISERWTLHDLRRSAATHMAEIGIEPHVIEAILNHASGHKAGVAGIYNRARYEKQMRTALAVWADHIASIISGSARRIIAFQQTA
jgi:integrase